MDKKKKAALPAKRSSTEPWNQANPKAEDDHQHLSPAEKAKAKKRARAAGRPYPNLVDNMRIAAEHKRKK